MKKSESSLLLHCPCGGSLPYSECCEPYHLENKLPPTAEALMRSRYSAYVHKHEKYLLATWHPQTRPAMLNLATESVKWLGLTILATSKGSQEDNEGTVEFIARYKLGGRAHKIAEKSFFVRQDSRWFYVDGEVKDK